MSYQVTRSLRAMRRLSHLRKTHHPLHNAIVDAIKALAETPRPPGCVKLVGRPEWRIRVADHRILYLVDDAQKTVTITEIGHRREIYSQ
ncbi:MAG: type II toxin-antitoxin system RelE/ParE family toxin [Acidobacteria bacterium]|nr:type II toxin-antitoxin system RelE/ParE family toxin [Acidobacteriota bacterium]